MTYILEVTDDANLEIMETFRYYEEKCIRLGEENQ